MVNTTTTSKENKISWTHLYTAEIFAKELVKDKLNAAIAVKLMIHALFEYVKNDSISSEKAIIPEKALFPRREIIEHIKIDVPMQFPITFGLNICGIPRTSGFIGFWIATIEESTTPKGKPSAILIP